MVTRSTMDAKGQVGGYLRRLGWHVRAFGPDLHAQAEDGTRLVVLPAAKSSTIGDQLWTGLDVERIASARRRAEKHGATVVLVLHHEGIGWSYQVLQALDVRPSDLVYDGRIRVWRLRDFLPLNLQAGEPMLLQVRLFADEEPAAAGG